jgi:hypothetical protein
MLMMAIPRSLSASYQPQCVNNLGSLSATSSGCPLVSRDLERHTVGLGDVHDLKLAPTSWKKGSAAGSDASHRCNALGDRTLV